MAKSDPVKLKEIKQVIKALQDEIKNRDETSPEISN
jgi:hypothetical protein